jgi:hypothetical protein
MKKKLISESDTLLPPNYYSSVTTIVNELFTPPYYFHDKKGAYFSSTINELTNTIFQITSDEGMNAELLSDLTAIFYELLFNSHDANLDLLKKNSDHTPMIRIVTQVNFNIPFIVITVADNGAGKKASISADKRILRSQGEDYLGGREKGITEIFEILKKWNQPPEYYNFEFIPHKNMTLSRVRIDLLSPPSFILGSHW